MGADHNIPFLESEIVVLDAVLTRLTEKPDSEALPPEGRT